MDSRSSRVRLAVHAHPGARREALELMPDGSVGVWVRARPVEGQANAAIERLLAEMLGVPLREVAVVRGGSGRQKLVEVGLPSLEDVRARLAHAVRAQRS